VHLKHSKTIHLQLGSLIVEVSLLKLRNQEVVEVIAKMEARMVHSAVRHLLTEAENILLYFRSKERYVVVRLLACDL